MPDSILAEILETEENRASTIGTIPDRLALGDLVYAAPDGSSLRADINVPIGRLIGFAGNLQQHGLISQPCRTPSDHPHTKLCTEWVDFATCRWAGSVLDGVQGRVILNTGGAAAQHIEIDFVAISSRGVTLFEPCPNTGIYSWFLPMEPTQMFDGRVVFRDRVNDYGKRVSSIQQARKSPLTYEALRTEKAGETFVNNRFERTLERELRFHKGAVQGILMDSEPLTYEDINTTLVCVPPVQHASNNPDAELLDARCGRGPVS